MNPISKPVGSRSCLCQRCRDDKLNVAEICKKFKLDPKSLSIGPDAIEVGNDGLSVDSIASIRQAGIEVGAGDGRSKDTPFILEQSLSASAQDDEQYKIRASAQDDEQHQKLISSTRDELRDSLEALPDLVSLPDFFRKPFPPVSESFYNRLPLQNRSEIFKPVSGSSPSLGDMPVIDMVHAILRDVDAQGTEDTFHYVYDSLIKSPLQFLYGKPLVYRRNSTSDSSLRAYRPDAIYLFGGYVLFKGDEKAEHTSGDPAEELLDNDAWPYGDSVPYIPAYYTRACSVNVCVLYQEQGQTRRRDLLRLDISKAEGRLDLVIDCVRIAQLVQKLEQICDVFLKIQVTPLFSLAQEEMRNMNVLCSVPKVRKIPARSFDASLQPHKPAAVFLPRRTSFFNQRRNRICCATADNRSNVRSGFRLKFSATVEVNLDNSAIISQLFSSKSAASAFLFLTAICFLNPSLLALDFHFDGNQEKFADEGED